MQTCLRFPGLGLALAFALTAGVAPASAGFMATVTGTATPESGGLTMYTYTVTDLAASTNNIGQFSLVMPANANLSSISMPNGYFADYTPGNLSIEFDSLNATNDLTPGNSETFSFVSPDAPGQSSFTVLDYNDYSTLGGSVVAPNSVPEPGSLVLLGLGLPIAVVMLARRRSRRLVGSSSLQLT